MLPVLILYFPATHSAHVPPSSPCVPALHIQALASLLAAGAFVFTGHPTQVFVTAATMAEYWPATQLVHIAFPGAILYLPYTHAAHVPQFSLV